MLELGALAANPGPNPATPPRATQAGSRGEGVCLQEGVPQDGPAHLPTTISSCSVAFLRKRCHTSMANSVLLLLKMEVSELMRAAMITAIIKPRRPGERRGLCGQLVMKALPGTMEAAAPTETGVWVGMGWGRCWLSFPQADKESRAGHWALPPNPPTAACSVALGEPGPSLNLPRKGCDSPDISCGCQSWQTLASGHQWGGSDYY